jgi:hypothetical protein
MDLDSLSPEEVVKLELATGVPTCFKIDGAFMRRYRSGAASTSAQRTARRSRRRSSLRPKVRFRCSGAFTPQ